MAICDPITGNITDQDDNLPHLNGPVAVIVGTPVVVDLATMKYKLGLLKDGLIYFGKFKCNETPAVGDVVIVEFSDANNTRGKVKKVL